MAYVYLTGPIKNKVLRELRASFSAHPVYQKVAEWITTSYPFEERPQQGILLKSVSGEPLKLTASNFVGTVISAVSLAKFKDTPGTFIEWVKEDLRNVMRRVREDLSAQATGGKFTFQTDHRPVVNASTGELDDVLDNITFFVNDRRVGVSRLDGRNGLITLLAAPPTGAKLEAEYVFKDMAKPGFYVVELETESTVKIIEFFVQERQVLSEAFDPAVTQFLLGHQNVTESSETVLSGIARLERGTDYAIDYRLGTVEILDPSLIPPARPLTIEYKFQGETRGPFLITPWSARNDILRGVIFAFSNRLKQGDRIIVGISDDRLDVAEEFGGRTDLTVELDVYARDLPQKEEIADLVFQIFWGEIKERLDTEGVSVKNVSMGGESTDTYDPLAQSLYFITSITLNLEADWSIIRPMNITFAEIVALSKELRNGTLRNFFDNVEVLTDPRVSLDRQVNFERIL